MAVIFGVCDPRSERREIVRRQLPRSLTGLPSLERASSELGTLSIFWEAPASTPISVATNDRGPISHSAFVVGDFAAPYSPKSDAAERLLKMAEGGTDDPTFISGQDGYYLAMLCEGGSRIVLGTDTLGMFPLYFWASEEVFLFGTSPELFKAHPNFTAIPNPYGLASILLVNHISGGQSLYRDVRRSTPGKYVSWDAETGLIERDGNPLVMSESGFGLTYPETKHRFAAALDAYHENLRHIPELNVFLSGGQDSRMVAGYIARHRSPKHVKAVSIGHSGDQELSFARKVSKKLRWDHHFADIAPAQHLHDAKVQLRLETLQGPFASFYASVARKLLSTSAGPFVSGYSGDAVLGDTYIYQGFSRKRGVFEFETLLSNISKYGFPLNDVADLLKSSEGQSAIHAVVERMHSEWDAVEGHLFQKAWMFRMTHRNRYHVGSIMWRLSLGAWHLLPYVHRPLLELTAGTPLDYLGGRRIQADILKDQFRDLARIPLDRNTGRPEYLIKPPLRKFVDGLPNLSEISWRLHGLAERAFSRERRYYFRIYDYNSTGWRAIRHEADNLRPLASSILNPEALDRLLPTADNTLQFGDGIVGPAKLKTLAGIVIWNGMSSRSPQAPRRDEDSDAVTSPSAIKATA